MKASEKNVALIIPGGIGTGKNNIGVPVLERIVKLLSKDVNVTVFSLFRINADYHQNDFELVDVSWRLPWMKYWKLLLHFRNHHRKKQFGAIHGFWALPSGFFSVVLGKVFKVKTVVSILGGDAVSLPEIKYGQLQKFLSRQLVFWTLREADEVISLTQYLVDSLMKLGFVRKNRIRIIPWGIDTSLFQYSPKARSSPVQFLHIGNLNFVKDQETLLRAFKIISDQIPAHLAIVGEGPLENKLRELTNSLSLREQVTFMPLVPYENLPAIYHNAHVLLHTSLSEGQCEVVTEAMSCGLLVCGTRVGLMYDLSECCVSVPVKDFQALATSVLSLLEHKTKQEMIRASAMNWSNQHSISWTTQNIIACYFSNEEHTK